MSNATDREALLSLLRIRPDWLESTDPDPSDDEYWETPDEIRQRYYDNGAEVNISKLVDMILAAGFASSATLAATRTAAFEEAATLLGCPIGVQVTNGVGWIPADSRAGAARYLQHLARAGEGLNFVPPWHR